MTRNLSFETMMRTAMSVVSVLGSSQQTTTARHAALNVSFQSLQSFQCTGQNQSANFEKERKLHNNWISSSWAIIIEEWEIIIFHQHNQASQTSKTALPEWSDHEKYNSEIEKEQTKCRINDGRFVRKDNYHEARLREAMGPALWTAATRQHRCDPHRRCCWALDYQRSLGSFRMSLPSTYVYRTPRCENISRECQECRCTRQIPNSCKWNIAASDMFISPQSFHNTHP